MQDVHRTLGSLQRQNAKLELDTTALCFLVALRARGELGTLASFADEILCDVYEQVCDITDPAAPNKRKRATHAIERLREQRLLARVDGAGLVRAGEYALTRLGAAIVDFYCADETLTRESLALLTAILQSQLSEIRAAAMRADSPEAWRAGVVEPLKVTIGELVGGIERRQRGMDAQQEEVQAQIGELLRHDWFRAIDACEQLLDATTTTLQELNLILLRDTGLLQALLQEIQQAAAAAAATEAEIAAHSVSEQLERVAAWGGARQRAWSEYYQYVQRFLRTVVRLDPHRALSQRLRDGLAAWPDTPSHLIVAAAPPLAVLRELEARVERPPVARPHCEREQALGQVAPDEAPLMLESHVREALAMGAMTLWEVVSAVLPAVPPSDRFKGVGTIAALVVSETRVTCKVHERPWRKVASEIEIEDWNLTPKESR